MELNQIIAPDSISGLLIMIGTVGAAVIASLSIKTYKEQKSYDFFTVKRLKTYDSTLNIYQEIMSISAPKYILEEISNSKEKYMANYESTYARIFGLLSTVGKQEYYLLREYEILRKEVYSYIDSPTPDNERQLNDQRDCIKYFTDIYLWALWNYIQRLHKMKDENQYHNFYDEQFEKIFERSREQNASDTVLFKKYKVDMLVDQCKYKHRCHKYLKSKENKREGF